MRVMNVPFQGFGSTVQNTAWRAGFVRAFVARRSPACKLGSREVKLHHMGFCANCGSQAEGAFCPKCGAAINAAGGAAAAAPSGAGPVAPAAAGLTDNVASALCYVMGLITGILFLVLAPYNQNRKIRFHAFQSIFLHVAAIVIWIAFLFLSAVSGGMLIFVSPLIWLAFFVLWIVMIIKAYQDQKLVLPIIGPLAEKQA